MNRKMNKDKGILFIEICPSKCMSNTLPLVRKRLVFLESNYNMELVRTSLE